MQFIIKANWFYKTKEYSNCEDNLAFEAEKTSDECTESVNKGVKNAVAKPRYPNFQCIRFLFPFILCW